MSWPTLDIGSRSGAPPRVQWCHGAPGMITLFTGDLGAALVAASCLTVNAGFSGIDDR